MVLLVGVVVVSASAVGSALLLSAGGPDAPSATADAAAAPDELAVTHTGGEGVAFDELVVAVDAGSGSTVVPLAAGNVTGDGDDAFDPGERWVRSWADLNVSASGGDRVGVRVLHTETGDALFDGTLVVPAGPGPGVLEGTVVDDAGDPVADTEVTISGDGLDRTTTTDASGGYRLEDVPAGDYDGVTATADGYNESDPVNVTVPPNGAASGVDFQVAERTAAVNGTVTDARSGDPIEGATVEVARNGTVVATASTNATGEYRIDGLDPDEYDVTADANGYAAETTAVTLNGSEEAVVNASLDRQVRIGAVEPFAGGRSGQEATFLRLQFDEPTNTSGWVVTFEASDGTTREATLPDATLSGTVYLSNDGSFARRWSVPGGSVSALADDNGNTVSFSSTGEHIRLRSDDDVRFDEVAYGSQTTSRGWSLDLDRGQVGYRERPGEAESAWNVSEENRFFSVLADSDPRNGSAVAVYVDSANSYVTSVDGAGRVGFFDVQSPGGVGPMTHDLDGDGLREVPYVDRDGDIRIVDFEGEDAELHNASETGIAAKTGETRLAVGVRNGAVYVYFVGSAGGTDDLLFEKQVGGGAQRLQSGGGGGDDVDAVAVAGLTADEELVFVTPNDEIAFLELAANNDNLRTTNAAPGAQSALGDPAGFGGSDEAPFLDGNDDVALVEIRNNGGTRVLTGSVTPGSGPMATRDVDADGDAEVVLVTSGGRLRIVEPDGTARPLTDEHGHERRASAPNGVV